jgi:hypothetical protein
MRLNKTAIVAALILAGIAAYVIATWDDVDLPHKRSGHGAGHQGDATRPYPYTTPVPPRETTAIDGTFVRRLPSTGSHVHCRRCAPYRLEGGHARLTLSEGEFFLKHKLAGFASLGHYVVSGDEVEFFNDPNCPTMRGRYRWSLEDGRLEFEVIEDECPYADLRSRYLTAKQWKQS